MKIVEAPDVLIEVEWVYTPCMATLDDKSVRKMNDGNTTVDFYTVEKTPHGMIRISFIRKDKMTGDHIDEYTIVNQVVYRLDDAKKLVKTIQEVIEGKSEQKTI